MLLRAVSLCSIVALAILSLAAESPPESWSDAELRTLRSLWIGSLGSPPPDPSNRHADDPEAAALGHRLFFETGLSRNGKISCATCHDPAKHFTDGRARSKALGRTRRGAPTLIGTAYSPWFYWDGRRDSQWSQALAPLEAPEEMGGSRLDQVRFVANDPSYRESYEAVFGTLPRLDDPPGVDRAFANLGKAIAAYERKLIPGPARFDRYVEQLTRGETEPLPLNGEEIAGLRLFLSSESQCLRCHNGPLFTNHGFHNVGSPQAGGDRDFGRLPAIREVLEQEFNCLGEHSDARAEQCIELNFVKREGEELPGAFKVPTLRNVAETAPYFHAGQFGNLRSLLKHYSEPRAGIGHLEIAPMNFTGKEIGQLESFLGTLTSAVEADPRWLSPPVASAAEQPDL